MSISFRITVAASVCAFGLAFMCARAQADDAPAVTTPPPPPPAPLATTTPPPPPPALGTGDVPLPGDDPVSAGPLQNERRALYNKIMQAKQAGVGITNYLTYFKAIEDSARNGDPQDGIHKRIDSISSSLDDQLKRSQILKTQHLAPPVIPLDEPARKVSNSGGSTQVSASTQQLIDQAKSKYADKIPAGLDTNQLLNSDLGKQILQKLQNR